MVYSMLILWILNDHLLKAQFGNVWTGKLSDIAGLVVFPLFMLASYQVIARLLGQWRPQDRAVLWKSIFSTGFIFSAVNLSERWSALFETLVGYLQWPIRATWSLLSGVDSLGYTAVKHTQDPTDLLTLPALCVAAFIGCRYTEPRPLPQRDPNEQGE